MSEQQPAGVSEETATFSRFARIAGFKPSYVTQLKNEGRLVLTDDGKRVKVRESLERMQATRDPSRTGVADRHAAERKAKAAEQADVPRGPQVGDGDDADPDDAASAHRDKRAEAQARREVALAAQAEHDLAVSQGKKLDRDEVRTVLSAAIVTLRSRLESQGHILAPQLVGITDEARIRTLIDAENRHALTELARQFAALSREQQT